MPINILMPALSPTMEEGNLAKWLVKEGDSVSSGDVIAEIETDKATMEVEAVEEGTVGRILVADGTTGVKVNEVIAILLEEGEDASALDKEPAPAAAPAPSAKPEPAAEPAPRPSERQPVQPTAAKSGNGAAGPQLTAPGERIFASPLARRMAREAGIDLAAIGGSGPHGRIVRRDVEAATAGGATPPAAAAAPAKAAAPAAAPAAPAMSDEQIKGFYEAGTYEERPHDGMRRTIARRLTESKQTVPHFYLTVDCRIDALLSLRAQVNAAAPKDGSGNPAYKVSVNDFVIKAMALALQAVPAANATWTEASRLLHRHSDVGVAVAIPDGLFTPVIRKAEQKTLSVIANEMKDLAKRARDKKLAPHEYQGGTTAVSNLGMYGIREFSAVINPPHGTILAVGAGEQRAIVEDGEVKAATVMSVTLSCDHRAVDGALGAELLAAFKTYIENPMGMLV
jgi:pyruvate dehydrogenase E2 component (dihydrolipoamide acetyltransferase)